MISYAREKAIEMLKTACTAILATSGPAGVLASEFPCEAFELEIYLLLPQTSDHLFNLEHHDRVALHTKQWEATGTGRTFPPDEKRPLISLLTRADSAWHALVQVKPSQIHVLRSEGWGSAETIDIGQFR